MSSVTKPTNVRWLVLVLASSTSFILYLHRYTWAIIRPQLEKEYGFSNTELEQIFALFNFTYALGQIPSGVVCDYFGAHVFLGSIVGLWSVGLILFALVGSFWAFGGIRLIFGAAQAGGYPGLSNISGNWFAPANRTTFQGFIASFAGRMGGAFAPLLMATLLMGYYGLDWRASLMIMGSLGVFLAVAFLVLFRNSPLEDKRVNKEELDIIKKGAEPKGRTGWLLTPLVIASSCIFIFGFSWKTGLFLAAAVGLFFALSIPAILNTFSGKDRSEGKLESESQDGGPQGAKPKKQILNFSKAAKHRSYQLLVFQQFANAGADIVYTSVLGSVFMAKGSSIAEMGVYASLPLFGGAIGGYVGGYLNDILISVFGSRRWGRSAMGFLGKAIATVFLFVAISQESAESLAWGLFVVKFFSDWSQPTIWGTCTDLGGKNAGTVFSIVNTTGNIGALVVPLFVGPLLDYYSTIEIVNGVSTRITDFIPMFNMVAVLYMLSAVAWLFINCSNPIDPESTSTEA